MLVIMKPLSLFNIHALLLVIAYIVYIMYVYFFIYCLCWYNPTIHIFTVYVHASWHVSVREQVIDNIDKLTEYKRG